MMKNRKLVKGIALAAVITALAAGGTAAYLTDFETATNSFTVGKVDIDLDEPNWKPEDNTDLVPTQVIRKDPYVANKGVNEAFVYLEVSVPVRNVITVAKDGTRNALAKTELFSFTKNKDWTQLERTEVGQNMVYTYAYNHILKPGTKTTTLFDTVTFANIIEGQLDTQQIDMPVRAYAIQATNTGDDKTTVLEQATAAYQKYVNQNKGQVRWCHEMNKLKRPVFLLLTAGLLCATGTAAYFSDFEKKINSAAVGYVTTEIEEDFPDPTPTPMENGPSYRKEIRIGNFSGSVKGFQADCYVRMSLSYSNDDIGRGVKLTGLDTANWVYNSQDGYYYYRKKISEGEKTTPLCTGFQIDPQKIDDTYKDSIKDFEINVYEEAVQAEGFSDYESAWRYFSDPVSAQAERRGNA